jgi:hypothetical protein
MAKETLQQIKSYEDACAYNGKQPIDEQALISLGITPKQVAGIKLEEITLALNKGTAVDIFDRERRYYPWFWTYNGPAVFAFDCSCYVNSFAIAGGGSRLAYREKAASDYSGKQFIELWKEYLS